MSNMYNFWEAIMYLLLGLGVFNVFLSLVEFKNNLLMEYKKKQLWRKVKKRIKKNPQLGLSNESIQIVIAEELNKL